MNIDLVQPSSAAQIKAVEELWAEYWQSFGLPLDFQGFAQELRTLPGKYAPPAGCLLLAQIEGHPAATGAFRRLSPDACEAKRLYVRPTYRRLGLAGALVRKLIEQARLCGYRDLYADTLPSMTSALDLYRRVGFVEVGPYSEDPTPGAVYLHLVL
jgi:ribosomal protein S18 acetylase RimI-like enzyme